MDLNDFGVWLFNLRRSRVTDKFIWHSFAGKLLRAALRMTDLVEDDPRNLYKRLALAVHPDKCATVQEKMAATVEMQALGWAKLVVQLDQPAGAR
eukprot:gene8942-9119_t